MSLNIEQVRTFIDSKRDQAGEMQTLLALLRHLKLMAAASAETTPVVHELETRIRELAKWEGGADSQESTNAEYRSITRESFQHFMGDVPYAPNAAFASTLKELETRGVVWTTRLTQPPMFTGLIEAAQSKRVLALGSLEGNLEWTLATGGATRVLGVEAYIENYNKCLLLKTLFPDLAFDFLYADVQQMEVAPEFDIIVCPGVLYHLHQPQKLLLKLRELKPRQVYISTQIAVEPAHPASAFHVLGGPAELSVEGETYRGRWWSDVQKDNRNFHCGLDGQPSFWFYPEELRRCLQDLGFEVVMWNLFDMGRLGVNAMTVLSLPQ
ncbi:MAG TPA: methyltransferase domain-containing protein [Pyrinomonadaceae bacterium]|jgi:2-polyprenyl-3-methyl-5-hydroxy-6-metoxy-1,4-benzoquinol methylase|nr:methyltransferase domain-containing protein [Pyrinomonadaceae bacterium]